MQDSKLALLIWLWAAWLMATHSNGISSKQLGRRNDPHDQPDARPRAPTGTSRAQRSVSLVVGTPRRARVPPFDDGDDPGSGPGQALCRT